MVSIRKFRIIVLVSNQIEYWSNYSMRNFEYSHSSSDQLSSRSVTSSGHTDVRREVRVWHISRVFLSSLFCVVFAQCGQVGRNACLDNGWKLSISSRLIVPHDWLLIASRYLKSLIGPSLTTVTVFVNVLQSCRSLMSRRCVSTWPPDRVTAPPGEWSSCLSPRHHRPVPGFIGVVPRWTCVVRRATESGVASGNPSDIVSTSDWDADTASTMWPLP